mmetsp:Transcript_153177/g.285440  ORF Transcript_153177/g.285440 Transcript_153177/m.285440 type:complete len:313 (+) Transcript_153177:366-1304(+)
MLKQCLKRRSQSPVRRCAPTDGRQRRQRCLRTSMSMMEMIGRKWQQRHRSPWQVRRRMTWERRRRRLRQSLSQTRKGSLRRMSTTPKLWTKSSITRIRQRPRCTRCTQRETPSPKAWEQQVMPALIMWNINLSPGIHRKAALIMMAALRAESILKKRPRVMSSRRMWAWPMKSIRSSQTALKRRMSRKIMSTIPWQQVRVLVLKAPWIWVPAMKLGTRTAMRSIRRTIRRSIRKSTPESILETTRTTLVATLSTTCIQRSTPETIQTALVATLSKTSMAARASTLKRRGSKCMMRAQKQWAVSTWSLGPSIR